jgi:probable metal-binding protein
MFSPMEGQIHGHEVMRMMIESGAAYTRASLRDAITGRFGDDARFYTCSADGMTADEIIAFLETRGKFVARDAGFSTSPDKICDH